MQLILGAAFRHYGIRLLPHLIGACVVVHGAAGPSTRADALWRSAATTQAGGLLLALLMVQLGLGFTAYLTRLGYKRTQRRRPITWWSATVAHVACGALLLATAVVLAIQTRRIFTAAQLKTSPSRARQDGDRMSLPAQPLAIPRGGIAALARDYSELIKARVTTLIVMTAWCGFYFAAAKSGVSSFPGRCCTRCSASAWSAAARRP